MPALCIQERTEPRLEGSSGSSFRWSPPRGRASCAGNIRTRSSWAPPTAKDRFPPRLWASQLSPTRRHREPPGAQRYTESWSLSARSPLRGSLSQSGSLGADAVPSPPGERGGEMEGFPRGLRAGEQTESGARTRSARRRPRGALWRLPRAAVVGGGGDERPSSCPPFPPPRSPPARPRRPRGALITIREGEAAAVELGGGDGGGRGGSNSSSRASRGKAGPAPGQQTQPPPGPRMPRRPGPAAAPGGSTCSRSSSRPADSPRGPVPGLPRRGGRRRPPLPGAWPRALAIPPPPPLPGEREPKGGSTGRRRAVASGWAQGTRGQGRRGRGARPAEGRPGT